MINEQIKSRKRVSDFGEVYTNDREIEAMIALVAKEAYKIETTFLEPSCGNGNFLIAVLKRKMRTVVEQFYDNKLNFEIYTLVAVSSIYGIDIQEDNIKESRKRILRSVVNIIKKVFNDEPTSRLLKSIRFILNKNILCGDFLSCKLANGEPILLSEWKITDNYYFRRKDFLLEHSLVNEMQNIQSNYIYYKWLKEIKIEGKEEINLGAKGKIG